MKLFQNKKNLILALIFTISASVLLPARLFAEPGDNIIKNALSAINTIIKDNNNETIGSTYLDPLLTQLCIIQLNIASVTTDDLETLSKVMLGLYKSPYQRYNRADNKNYFYVRTYIINIALGIASNLNPRLRDEGVKLLGRLYSLEGNSRKEKKLLGTGLKPVWAREGKVNALVQNTVKTLRQMVEIHDRTGEAFSNSELLDISYQVKTLFGNVPGATELPADFVEVFKKLHESGDLSGSKPLGLARAVFYNPRFQLAGLELFECLVSEEMERKGSVATPSDKLLIATIIFRSGVLESTDAGIRELAESILEPLVFSVGNVRLFDREKMALKFLEIATVVPQADSAFSAQQFIQAILATDSLEVALKLLAKLPGESVSDDDLARINYKFSGILSIERAGDNFSAVNISHAGGKLKVLKPTEAQEGASFSERVISKFWENIREYGRNRRTDIAEHGIRISRRHGNNSQDTLKALLHSPDLTVSTAAHSALSKVAVSLFITDFDVEDYELRRAPPSQTEWLEVKGFLQYSPELCFRLTDIYAYMLWESSDRGTDASFAGEILAGLKNAKPYMAAILRSGVDISGSNLLTVPFALVSVTEEGFPHNQDTARDILSILSSDNTSNVLRAILEGAKVKYNGRIMSGPTEDLLERVLVPTARTKARGFLERMEEQQQLRRNVPTTPSAVAALRPGNDAADETTTARENAPWFVRWARAISRGAERVTGREGSRSRK